MFGTTISDGERTFAFFVAAIGIGEAVNDCVETAEALGLSYSEGVTADRLGLISEFESTELKRKQFAKECRASGIEMFNLFQH